MLMKTGILYFTTCFHGFGILRHVDPCVRMLHIYDLINLQKYFFPSLNFCDLENQGMLFSASQSHGSRSARADWICASHLWLTQNFAYVTLTFLHSNRKMHDMFTARQWTAYCWSLYRSHRSLYRPLYSVKTIDRYSVQKLAYQYL